MALTVALALGLGLFAAARHGRPADLLVMGLSQLGISIPNFWFGLLLILLFAVNLGWLSAGGFPGWHAGLLPALSGLVLPSLSLAAVQAAIRSEAHTSELQSLMRNSYAVLCLDKKQH